MLWACGGAEGEVNGGLKGSQGGITFLQLRCSGESNLDASGQGYPVQGCQQGNMPVMQGQGPAWFGAQWIPQQQTFMQQNSQACVPSFGCASMPGGPRSGSFPNLGVNRMSCQGNMPSGPVGASLGGLTPQAAQIQEVMAMFVKTRERRGSSFSQLGLEPNHTGLTAQSLFFLEESCRVKRSDTQTSSNFSNYFKRVLKLQKRSSSFSK